MATSRDTITVSVKDCALEVARSMGYEDLKEEQVLVVSEFVGGKDVFVALPTGYGKSFCYGCLPGVFQRFKGRQKGIVVVVSPLVAIMKDQVASFEKKGVSAAHLAGSVDQEVKIGVVSGSYSLVFMSPEQLLTVQKWRSMLQSEVYREKLVAFVVDEAHCVKKWGDEFRTAFARLGEVRSLIPPSVGVMALTATATRSLRREVVKTLGMIDPAVVTVSPDKPNVIFTVSLCTTLEEAFIPLMEQLEAKCTHMDRVLIYCQRQDECAQLYLLFCMRLGENAREPRGAPDLPKYRIVDMYTSGTHPSVREEIVKAYTSLTSPLRILIATVAFGMGVNPPNVHFVFNYGPPNDTETYLQEVGRGGRDGHVTHAVLLFKKGLNRNAEGPMIRYCENVESCRRELLFSDFDEFNHSPSNVGCKCCDVCARKCQCGFCMSWLDAISK